MTVIVWDGNILAVDSRRTKKKIEIFDNSQKIDLNFVDCSFRGQRVLAVAVSGNVKTTGRLKCILRNGKDLESVFQKRFQSGALEKYKKGSLFIVTEQSAWQYRLVESAAPEAIEVGNKLFTAGSGGRTAGFLMRTFNLSPPMAVCATMLDMKCCGGPVRYVKRRGSKGISSVKTTEFEDVADLRSLVFDEMRIACNQRK